MRINATEEEMMKAALINSRQDCLPPQVSIYLPNVIRLTVTLFAGVGPHDTLVKQISSLYTQQEDMNNNIQMTQTNNYVTSNLLQASTFPSSSFCPD